MIGAGWTVADALAHAAARGIERFDAQHLLAHVLARPRAWLIAHDDARLGPDAARRYDALLARAAGDEPIAYLLGEAGFHELTLGVAPGVLVPRPDTEALVAWALECLPPPRASAGQAGPTARVLDLGTGSGAIALAIACARPDVHVTATDRSDAARTQAAANAQRLGLGADRVALRAGSWWQAVQASDRFDLIVSNPPYLAEDDPHLPALRHEPREALVAGRDGLDDLRAIAAGARAHLVPGGWLLLEHGWTQAAEVAALLQAAGFAGPCTRQDVAGRDRCTGARAPG